MQRLIVLAALLMIWSCSPSFDVDPQATRAEIMEADRAFAKRTAEKGLDGWVETFAEDGAMFPAGRPMVRGKDAVRRLMAPAFQDKNFRLFWEPTQADVSASGELGYTTGRFERTVTGPDGAPVTTIGKYITIWKKQPDSTWKVVADMGTPDEAP